MKKIDLLKDRVDAGFKTPPDYFDNLSASVKKRIEEQPDQPVIKLSERRSSWIYAAAAILLIALLLPLLNALLDKKSKEFNSAELEDYLVEHRQISSEELISYMDSEELPAPEHENHLDEQLIEDELVQNKNLELLLP